MKKTEPTLRGVKKLVTIGTSTLILGDCYSILPQLAGMYDAIIADPPYGIAYNPSNPTYTKWRDVKGIVGDDKPFDPTPLLSFNGPIVLFGANNYANRLPNSRRWYVWDKRPGWKSMSFSDCELVWCSTGGSARMIRHTWSGFHRGSERGEHWHPTQKPVAVMRHIIEQMTKPGDVILDPFMGSGSTALAAKECGRKFIGIEIDGRWFEAAVQRLKKRPIRVDFVTKLRIHNGMSKENIQNSSPIYALVTHIHERVDELAETVRSAREELERGETLAAVNITLSRQQEMRELVTLSEALVLMRRRAP